jgi:hypothetical protein
MSIPKDPIDDKPIIAPPAVQNRDDVEYRNEDGSPITDEQQEPVQVASLSNTITRKITDAVVEGADYLMGKKGADVLVAPKDKPGGVSLDEPEAITGDQGGGAAKKVEETVTETGEAPLAVTTDTGEIFTRPLSMEEMNDIRALMNNPEMDFDVVLPNLDYIDSGMEGTMDDKFKRLVAATYNAYKDKVAGPKGQLRKGYRGFDEIIKDANAIGSVDALIMLMQRKPGDRPFSDAELLAARRTVLSFEVMTLKLLNRYEKSGSDVDLAKAAQAMSVSAYAQIQLAGVQEDIGRLLVSNKIIAAPSKGRTQAVRTFMDTQGVVDLTAVIDGANVEDFINSNGGRETLMAMLSAYKHLPNDASRNRFARMTMMERAKMTPRMAVELFQSALLTSGVTHAYNAAGQAVFMELLMVERLLMGEVAEAGAMLKAQALYIPQAFKAMAHALVYEKSITEQVSKLDTSGRQITRHGLGLRNRAEGGGNIESAFALATDGFGIAMRAGGYRPMLAIDEFFKAMGRGMQLEALSVRAGKEAYNAKMKELRTSSPEMPRDAMHEAAKEFSQNAYIRTRESQAAFEESSEFARMMTFQDDLPPMFAQYSAVMNNPITKIWIPFYKTPTQIIRRVSERSPLGLAMPSVLVDKIVKGNARDRKEAMTRIMMGTSAFATLMYAGTGSVDDGFVITGYGPTDPKLRKEWLNSNVPYSIGIRKEDGSWDWVSYSRYDPVSGVLAMAADTADVIYNVEDDDLIADLLIHGGTSSMRYVGTSLPMTQFIGELVDLAGSPMMPHESKMERLREVLAKQVIEAGGIMKEHITTGGMYGIQLKGTVERSGLLNENDRFASVTMPQAQYDMIPGIGMQPEIRAYYEALNTLCSKTPGCSSDLPVKTNRWNEPVPQSRGTGWEVIQPWRIINKPEGNAINKELLDLGFGLSPLTRSMDEPMIKLTNVQYARYVELYNNPASSIFAEDYFKVGAYKGITLPPEAVAAFAKEISEDNIFYHNMPSGYGHAVPSNKKHKKDRLQKIDTEYKAYAKGLMLLEFPELKALTMQRDAWEAETGKNPKYLLEPTAGETEQAILRNIESQTGVPQ